MHEPAFSKIKAYVRHLAFDAKEQQVTNAQLVAPKRLCRIPELFRGSRYRLAGAQVGVLYEPTAIEAARAAAAVAVWDTDLVQCDSCRGFSQGSGCGVRAAHRFFRGN